MTLTRPETMIWIMNHDASNPQLKEESKEKTLTLPR